MRKIALSILMALMTWCFVNFGVVADETQKATELNIFTGVFPNIHFSLSFRVISIPGILCLSSTNPTILALYIFFNSRFPPM